MTKKQYTGVQMVPDAVIAVNGVETLFPNIIQTMTLECIRYT